MRLAVNARVASQAMGGQQRVTAEILNRLGDVDVIAPSQSLGGMKGHLWEQTVLPWGARGKLLWSPSASGPLAVRRQVVTLHDVAFLDVPEFFSRNFVRAYAALVPRLARRVDKIVTVSEFSRQRIAKLFKLDPASVEVIPNGVSSHFRPYGEDEIARVRAALNLPPRYVLLQATSDRRKNLKRTLEAWGVAQSSAPPDLALAVTGNLARAHVYGDLGKIEATPRTHLLGFVDEAHIGPLMAGAEAFLFPSIYEGFGMPIVEAMACGAPVLTADATATAEVAGDAALLVDPQDTRAIAAGINRLISDAPLREQLRAAGLERARAFDWDDAAAQYRALFARLGAPL
jgi:glycosyltransferase involved in cell wall biosynthesis